MTAIKLVSINVERSKHLSLALPFLEKEAAEVVCIQELCERDIQRFENILGACRVYAPSGIHPPEATEEESVVVGVGIFSRQEMVSSNVQYYVGSERSARSGPVHRIFSTSALVACELEKESTRFRIMTTHFTWSSHGQVIDAQRRDMEALL